MATDALVAMEKAMARDGIVTNDRQLACARINSQVGGMNDGVHIDRWKEQHAAGESLYFCFG